MAELPLILAGPMVRRVEPRLVCVWVAVSRASALLLDVFEGPRNVGTGSEVFEADDAKARGAANTLRVGEQLHVGVAVAEIPQSQQPLLPGVNYSYNLSLGPFVGSALTANAAVLQPTDVRPTDDLRSGRLLQDGVLDGHPHLALGYEPGELPGFALTPADLTDLRLLHGSCRRPGFSYRRGEGKKTFDGLAWVDDLILGWRRGEGGTALDANTRPHQLFLTGDQIYADDVAASLLPLLNRLGNQLLGRVELLPTRYPPEAKDDKKELYFGVPKQPGFATLAEFFQKMKKDKRHPLEALKRDRRVRMLAEPCLDRKYELLYGRELAPQGAKFTVDPSVKLLDAVRGPRAWPADLQHFPAGMRRPVVECESKLTSTDLANHLLSLAEYSAMYLAVWCNTAWPLTGGGRPELATIDEVHRLPSGPLPQIWDLHLCPGEDKGTWAARKDVAAINQRLEKERRNEDRKAGFADQHDTLNAFYDALPRVRRALANIPTYMVFDDHDVTDDWNLGRAWRDQVHTSPLGRRVLSNALTAYTLFQDWGNDPLRYRDAGFRELLVTIAQLYSGEAASHQPAPAATEALGKLFGLNQPNPEDPPPRLKWHFTIDGSRHRVVALDTRTRRHFRSRYLAAGLLSEQALDEQLPDPSLKPMPAGIEVLVILSQTSVVMPALAVSAIVPVATRISEASNRHKWRNLIGVNPDNEIWPGDDGAYEALLARLAAYRRVVVLSGEIHWAFSAQMSYWRRGLKRLDLDASLEPDLDGAQLTTRLATGFRTAGFPLSDQTCVVPRAGNAEWLVIDPPGRKMFLVRKESDGLNVFEEDEPARFAQFTSSGLKNIASELAMLIPWLGFAFPLVDRLPSDRLIWLDKTPPPVRPPEGGRFPPAVRDRVGREPVLLPGGNWPPGTRIGPQPDACWRADMVRDERAGDGPDPRPEFARAAPMPPFQAADLEGSYRRIAEAHGRLAGFRFTRGALYQSNLGLVRFELDQDDLVARHDLISHEPGFDVPATVSVHRVPLNLFGEQRPQLRFDLPAGA
jgi:hypothetical protein